MISAFELPISKGFILWGAAIFFHSNFLPIRSRYFLDTVQQEFWHSDQLIIRPLVTMKLHRECHGTLASEISCLVRVYGWLQWLYTAGLYQVDNWRTQTLHYTSVHMLLMCLSLPFLLWGLQWFEDTDQLSNLPAQLSFTLLSSHRTSSGINMSLWLTAIPSARIDQLIDDTSHSGQRYDDETAVWTLMWSADVGLFTLKTDTDGQ